MGTISAQMRVSILNGLACAEFACQLVLGVQCTDNTKIIDSTNKAQAHTVYTKTQTHAWRDSKVMRRNILTAHHSNRGIWSYEIFCQKYITLQFHFPCSNANVLHCYWKNAIY